MSTTPKDDQPLSHLIFLAVCWPALLFSLVFLGYMFSYPSGDPLLHEVRMTRMALFACTSLVSLVLLYSRR